MNSRTSNSFKNLISTILPYIIIGILGFIKIRVFVDNLSDDIVSLNQLFYQLFSYLALAEAGFGVFIIQKYYKSFTKNNKKETNEIFSTSMVFFKYLGIFILIGGILCSLFVNIFTKANVSNLYLRTIFIIFIIKNSIDYFMMAPRFVIQADQKMYKINYKINLFRILEIILEIILMLLGADYLIILLPGIPMRIIFNKIINNIIYKEYPWLKSDNVFRKKHIKGISNLISQKIAGILYSNTDIVLISSFLNPISVVAYTSYNYITKFISDTIYMASQAFSASFANVLNKENEAKKLTVFSELNVMFLFLSSICVVILYYVFENLIVLWIGKEYLITKFAFYLFLMILFIDISKRMLYIVINTEGIFKETKKIIILEAFLNFVLSLLLIKKYGISGVMLGTATSSLLTTSWYIPNYIYKNIFHCSPLKYLKEYLSSIIITILTIYILKFIPISFSQSITSLMYITFTYSLVALILLSIMYYIFNDDFKNLINKILVFLKERKKNNKL